MSRDRIFAVAATTAVLIGLALGFHGAGSPGLQRLANMDQVRIEDLNLVSQAVRRHYAAFGTLPATLANLGNAFDLRLNDPETRMVYEYRPLDERRFQLCAVFSTDNRTEAQRSPRDRAHGAGRQCFIYPE
jgi:hypothetical protein